VTRIFDDNSLTIGNTPLVRLNRITRGFPAMVLAKIEGRNPAYSVKCRVGGGVWLTHSVPPGTMLLQAREESESS